MATVIKNDASRWQSNGIAATTMVIDATNNEVDTDIVVALDADTEYYQIQVQVTGGALFTMDGTDPTSATPFRVNDDFTVVWNKAQLRASRWAQRGASSGTLIIQGVKG